MNEWKDAQRQRASVKREREWERERKGGRRGIRNFRQTESK